MAEHSYLALSPTGPTLHAGVYSALDDWQGDDQTSLWVIFPDGDSITECTVTDHDNGEYEISADDVEFYEYVLFETGQAVDVVVEHRYVYGDDETVVITSYAA